MTKTKTKKRILVIDDDPAVTATFKALLTHGGYEVFEADYALPALFRAARWQLDLIVADLDMPVMNGLELIDQYKQYKDTRDIPVLVVTGSISDESRTAAFKAGCAGYLTKPVSAKELLGEIARLLAAKVPKKVKSTKPAKSLKAPKARKAPKPRSKSAA